MQRIIPLFIIFSLLIFTKCGRNSNFAGSETVEEKDWTLGPFEKADSINPILLPSSEQVFFCPVAGKEVRWEERNVLNPSAIVKDGRVWLLYRAQDKDMTSRVGLAVSDDGLHFTKEQSPVLYPDS
ncbi:MAG: glycosidase, partial [Bacteroidota bacterium]|nr:glycosidase [Bacteroidota bacterium]